MLVTADRGLVKLRDRIVDLPEAPDLPRGPMPLKLGRVDIDRRLHEHADEIARLSGVPNESALARLDADADRPNLDGLSHVIENLELELLRAVSR